MIALQTDTGRLMAHKAKHEVEDDLTYDVGQQQSPTRAFTKRAIIAKINSLVFNPVEWLDAEERKELLQQRKMQAVCSSISPAGAATLTANVIPYASAPWRQGLTWPVTKPMNTLQAGRMISVSLRTHSDLFVDRLEVLARKDRLEKDEQLFARFDAAFKERDMGSVLTTVADARQHITDLLASAEMEAASWVRDHKDVPEARAALEGRTRQQRELQGFFTSIQRSVTSGSAVLSSQKKKDSFVFGAWESFFEVLRAGQHNVDIVRRMLRRGQRARASRRGASKGASSDDSSCYFASSAEDSDGSDQEERRKQSKKQRTSGRRRSRSPDARSRA